MRRLVIPASALLFAGCYTYIPVESTDAEPGLSVRARVSATTGARIAPLLGATDARRLDGTIVTRSGDSLIVEVPTVMTDARDFGRNPNQRISLARSELLDLEVRKLDRFRTTALAGGAAILVSSFLIKTLRGEPGKEPLPGGGGTDAIVFRWIW